MQGQGTTIWLESAKVETAGGSSNPEPQPLSVSASTDRGKGAVYKEGENLVVLATVNQSAYIRIYHIDVNQKVQRIYPNRFGGGDDDRLRGDRPYSRNVGQVRIQDGTSFGTEFYQGRGVPTKAFSSDDEDFTDLSGDTRTNYQWTGDQYWIRRPIRAEALASYVIVPAQQ